MRGPLFLVISGILGIASIAVALALASLQHDPVIRPPTDSAGIAVVARYYKAVSHMIATGDPSLLRGVVDSQMYEIDATNPEQPGMSDVEHRLMFLHEATPDARLEAVLSIGGDSEITALVSVRRTSVSSLLGILLDDRTMLWPRVERFRVMDSHIVERAANMTGLFTIELSEGAPLRFDIPPNRQVTTSLVTFAPQVTTYNFPVHAPDLLWVLSGDIAVQPPEPDADDDDAIFTPAASEHLLAGEGVLMSARSGYFVTNAHVVQSSFLQMSIPYTPPPSEQLEQYATRSPAGSIVQPLARFELQGEAIEAEIAFGHASLMPGGRLTIDSSTKVMIVCTDAGFLRCLALEPNTGKDGIERIDPYETETTTTVPALVLEQDAGNGIVMNTGSEPTSVWILAISVDANGVSKNATPSESDPAPLSR